MLCATTHGIHERTAGRLCKGSSIDAWYASSAGVEVMFVMRSSCPICSFRDADVTRDSNRDLYHITCRRCGKFGVTGQADQMVLRRVGKTSPPRWLISAWVRSQANPPTLTNRSLEELSLVLVEPSAAEKTERFMVAAALARAGDTVDLDLNLDYPLLWVSSPEQAATRLEQLRDQGEVRVESRSTDAPRHQPRVVLTAKGAAGRGGRKGMAHSIGKLRPNTAISEITRRDILDEVQRRGTVLAGRLHELEFWSRIFDVEALISTDARFRTAAEDITQHRIRNDDWPEHWAFSYEPFDLLACDDEKFTKLLCELVHPAVRANPREVEELVALLNCQLRRDGWELYTKDAISGRPVYGARIVPNITTCDVLLSYNSQDQAEVKELCEALRARGLRPWLDDHEILPGDRWQEVLEVALDRAPAFAVMVGGNGFGPWHMKEMRAALDVEAKRQARVIPVLLPSAPMGLELPQFLKEFAWSDMRSGFSDQQLDRLVKGIRKAMGLRAKP